MELPIPTINLPPPYSSEITPVTSSRSPNTYQTTATTNVPDIGRILQNPNTTINMTNSSDVVIGPMTQFNERVTIYQYMDANLNHPGRAQLEKPFSVENSSSKTPFRINIRKHWLNILAICATILGITTTIYFIFYTDRAEQPRPPIVFGRNYDSDTFPSLYGHYIIDREKWGALDTSFKLKNFTVLKHPIKYVVVTHMGVQTEPCFNIYTCSIKMRAIQDNSIGNKGALDVRANFYLGGDGNIYTGRGWDYENSYGDKSLAVQFLGDFMRYDVEEKQFEAMSSLLNYGRVQNYLSSDYKLFGLNQTKLSKYSPGINVLKRIKNLPRFSWCGEEGYEPCGIDLNINWNRNRP